MTEPAPSIYEKNVSLLNERYPGFLDNLAMSAAAPGRPEEHLEFEFLTGKNGFPTFSVTDRTGRKVYGHSMFDPIKEAEKKYRELVDEKWDRINIYGFGFGYHIKYLLEHTKDRIITVVEPCISVFQEALRRVDLTPIFDRGIMLTFTMNSSELAFFITSGVSPINMPEYRNIELPYLELIPEMKRIRREALGSIRDQMIFNLFTQRLGGPIMWKNTISNFASVSRSPGLNMFADCMADRPVFVVAPGPSLERNVEQLHRVKGRALIIAVDTATRILNRHGIRPDAIVSVDFQQENYDKLKDVDTSDAYLLPAIEVCPEIPRAHKGRIISYYHFKSEVAGLYDPIIGPRGWIPSGGSVLCDAVYIALRMGANPLVLMGVDLGFPGKRWYADGSFEDGAFTRDINEGRVELMEIPDVFGNPLCTYKSFFAFLNVFESLFPKLTTKVYDATEGGAAIVHTEAVTAEEAIDICLADDGYDPAAILDEIYSEFEPLPSQKLIGKIGGIIKRYDAILKLVERGLKCSEKAFDLSDHFETKKKTFTIQLQKLVSIKEKIKLKGSEIDFLAPLIDQAMAQVFHQETDAITDPKATPEEKRIAYRTVVGLEQRLYLDMKNAIILLKEHFEELKTELSKEADCEKTV